MPTVEIVRFPGSDEFVADNLVFKDCLSKLVKSEGCIGVYYGIQIEDNRSGYLFVIWETYDHHMKFTKHESYPAAIASLARAQAGPMDVQHVDFDEDAAIALGAPVTEVVTLEPKSAADKEARSLSVTKLKEKMILQESCHSFTTGESREKKGTNFVLVGWDSVQAHYDVVEGGVFPEMIKNLHMVNEIELKHTKLTKYTE
ncbi:hypothetical protein C0993_012102 [Termitomyces sp. T159_Od127]|nr:hypothetical protein C0993_012102 [Termitomyces sp. T159_Od127]